MTSTKRCGNCKQDKPTTDFYEETKRGVRQLMWACKPCGALRYSAWYAKNTEYARTKNKEYKRVIYSTPEGRETIRRQHIKSVFGLLPADYDALLEKQRGLCAICRKVCSSGNNLSVDHCHTTNQVRGLLCNHCNHGLGKFRDNPSLLRRAIRYLNAARAA